MPIVIAIALATWLSLVYYASFHPRWKHHARPPRSDAAGGVFEATHGGRQLMPLWGEPPHDVPGPRPASASETYQPGDAASAGQPGAASGTGPAEESRTAGIGQPPR